MLTQTVPAVQVTEALAQEFRMTEVCEPAARRTCARRPQQGTRIVDSEGIDARLRQHEYLFQRGFITEIALLPVYNSI
jgi:hypothetical protein